MRLHEQEVRGLCRSRVWTRLRHGTYAETNLLSGLADSQRHCLVLRGLLLRLHPRAVLSHVSAAAWLEMPLLDPTYELLHVTRDDLKASRVESGVAHHAAALPAEHVVRRHGAEVTGLGRTAVDMARTASTHEQAVAACDSALRAGVRRLELRAVMESCATWPGARTASRAVAFADGRSANPGESWSRVVLAQLGLPAPELQVPLGGDEGFIGRVDFLLRELGIVGEFDGKLKYRVPPGADPGQAGEVVWREKRREDRLRDLGFEVVRWIEPELRRPAIILARFEAAAARARARGLVG